MIRWWPILLLVCSGCNRATRSYEYGSVPVTNVTRVKVRITDGFSAPKIPQSLTGRFTIKAKVVDGAIPEASTVKQVRIRFYHGWADSILTNHATLTLLFSERGDLVRIAEIPRHITTNNIVIPSNANR